MALTTLPPVKLTKRPVAVGPKSKKKSYGPCFLSYSIILRVYSQNGEIITPPSTINFIVYVRVYYLFILSNKMYFEI